MCDLTPGPQHSSPGSPLAEMVQHSDMNFVCVWFSGRNAREKSLELRRGNNPCS